MRVDDLGIDLPKIPVKITHSRKKSRGIIKKFCGSSSSFDAMPPCEAITSVLERNDGGDTIYLVTMTDCLDYSASTDAAILAHEAVHVAIDYLGRIGEDDPSEELMAYTVQTVTRYLLEKHFAWKKKRLGKSR